MHYIGFNNLDVGLDMLLNIGKCLLILIKTSNPLSIKPW